MIVFVLWRTGKSEVSKRRAILQAPVLLLLILTLSPLQQANPLPSETIIMRLVAQGVSRQEAHEQIRVLSHEAGAVVKNEGKSNDLVDRIRGNDFFKPIWGELDGMLDAKLYTGRSAEIVERYCGPGGAVEKALKPYAEYIKGATTAELNV